MKRNIAVLVRNEAEVIYIQIIAFDNKIMIENSYYQTSDYCQKCIICICVTLEGVYEWSCQNDLISYNNMLTKLNNNIHLISI